MASVGVVRKLFLDSRYKVSGTDADFLMELPYDVDCTRTSSFFVASCSFANTYQTVTQFNNIFYWLGKVPNTNITFVYAKTLPVGAYDPNGLATALTAILNNPASGFQNVVFTFNSDIGTYTEIGRAHV